MITLNGEPLVRCEDCGAVEGQDGTVLHDGVCVYCFDMRLYLDGKATPCSLGWTGHNAAYCRCD